MYKVNTLSQIFIRLFFPYNLKYCNKYLIVAFLSHKFAIYDSQYKRVNAYEISKSFN